MVPACRSCGSPRRWARGNQSIGLSRRSAGGGAPWLRAGGARSRDPRLLAGHSRRKSQCSFRPEPLVKLSDLLVHLFLGLRKGIVVPVDYVSLILYPLLEALVNFAALGLDLAKRGRITH